MYGERKLAWTEVVDLLKSISEEEEKNCERAIVDEGPYKIGHPNSSKLQVAFSAYVSKSHAQKEKINKRVQWKQRYYRKAFQSKNQRRI